MADTSQESLNFDLINELSSILDDAPQKYPLRE